MDTVKITKEHLLKRIKQLEEVEKEHRHLMDLIEIIKEQNPFSMDVIIRIRIIDAVHCKSWEDILKRIEVKEFQS